MRRDSDFVVRPKLVPKGTVYRVAAGLFAAAGLGEPARDLLAFHDEADALDFLVRPERWPTKTTPPGPDDPGGAGAQAAATVG